MDKEIFAQNMNANYQGRIVESYRKAEEVRENIARLTAYIERLNGWLEEHQTRDDRKALYRDRYSAQRELDIWKRVLQDLEIKGLA